MGSKIGIPRPSLRRLPFYYRRLLQAIDRGEEVLSSDELGRSADVPGTQVRKDLSYLEETGRAGIGYNTRALAAYLQEFLGLVNEKEAVLVGVGNLGRALALYPGFAGYGLQIVALFDSDPAKVGQRVGGREILSIDKLSGLVQRLQVQMGIITVPSEAAQAVADALVAGGIRVIWNFAPCWLSVPAHVLVKSEDLAAELATLSHHIAQQKIDPAFRVPGQHVGGARVPCGPEGGSRELNEAGEPSALVRARPRPIETAEPLPGEDR